MVPIVIYVVVLTVCIFHFAQTISILDGTRHRKIVIRKLTAFTLSEWLHTIIDAALVGIPVAVEEFAEMVFSEVAGMVKHDVENNLHALGVCRIDERLEGHIFREVTRVNF